MRFQVVVKSGLEVVARVDGREVEQVSMEEILTAEQLLERLTGLRFHINVSEARRVTAELKTL